MLDNTPYYIVTAIDRDDTGEFREVICGFYERAEAIEEAVTVSRHQYKSIKVEKTTGAAMNAMAAIRQMVDETDDEDEEEEY